MKVPKTTQWRNEKRNEQANEISDCGSEQNEKANETSNHGGDAEMFGMYEMKPYFALGQI